MNANFKKYIIIGILCLIALIVGFLGFYKITVSLNLDQVEKPIDKPPLPVPNEEEYTKRFNDSFQKNDGKKTDDSSYVKTKNKHLEGFLKDAAKKVIKDIQFYGRVVDQFGEGVSGVTIDYSGTRSVIASGSGPDVIISDDTGHFYIDNTRGESLRIDALTNPGYMFSKNDLRYFTFPRGGIEFETTWAAYTKDNPYLIKAWKFDRFPKVKIDNEFILVFEPDGRVYTLTHCCPVNVKEKA